MNLQEQNKLLYRRAGFGISLHDYEHPRPVEEVVESFFPRVKPGPLEMISEEEWANNNPKALKSVLDETQRKEMRRAFKEKNRDINLLWMEAMVRSDFPLLEKTALFWHGHFATRLDNPYFDQKLLNTLRENALWNFGDLLKAVSKSAAMLQFLNNQQNKKQHPNENFAREVMELFTLGRGHYTEDDVKEAARAFTGWGFNEYGDFVFRVRQHDDGEKKFLGKTGNFDGDDILNILLEQKQTAIFITQKIYRYFVSDGKISERHVKQLADEFYTSGYDIGGLLRNIFTADWFYKEDIAGAKVKSPVELLVGYQRMLALEFDNDKTLINLQRVLGQYLFNPPNVAGWPGGKNWIDSSSLVVRMRLPEALFASKELNLSAKETDAEMKATHMQPVTPDTQPSKPFRIARAAVDWSSYMAFWQKYSTGDLPAAIAGYLLPFSISQQQLAQVVSFADSSSHDAYVKSLTILLMEVPEYQLT